MSDMISEPTTSDSDLASKHPDIWDKDAFVWLNNSRWVFLLKKDGINAEIKKNKYDTFRHKHMKPIGIKLMKVPHEKNKNKYTTCCIIEAAPEAKPTKGLKKRLETMLASHEASDKNPLDVYIAPDRFQDPDDDISDPVADSVRNLFAWLEGKEETPNLRRARELLFQFLQQLRDEKPFADLPDPTKELRAVDTPSPSSQEEGSVTNEVESVAKQESQPDLIEPPVLPSGALDDTQHPGSSDRSSTWLAQQSAVLNTSAGDGVADVEVHDHDDSSLHVSATEASDEADQPPRKKRRLGDKQDPEQTKNDSTTEDSQLVVTEGTTSQPASDMELSPCHSQSPSIREPPSPENGFPADAFKFNFDNNTNTISQQPAGDHIYDMFVRGLQIGNSKKPFNTWTPLYSEFSSYDNIPNPFDPERLVELPSTSPSVNFMMSATYTLMEGDQSSPMDVVVSSDIPDQNSSHSDSENVQNSHYIH